MKTKIHKLKKKVKLNKKKNAPKQMVQPLQPINPLNTRLSVRDQLLQRLNRNGGISMPPGYSQSPTDRLIRQNEAGAIEEKKKEAEVEALRKTNQEQKKKIKELNKEGAQAKLEARRIDKKADEADKQVVQTEHLNKQIQETQDKIDKLQLEINVIPLKKEKQEKMNKLATLNSTLNQLEEELVKNKLGNEISQLDEEINEITAKITAKENLAKSRQYADSVAYAAERFQLIEQQEFRNEMAEDLVKRKKEAIKHGIQNRAFVPNLTTQKAIATTENELRKINVDIFNNEQAAFPNKLALERHKANQEKITKKTLRNDGLRADKSELEEEIKIINENPLDDDVINLTKEGAGLKRGVTARQKKLNLKEENEKIKEAAIEKDAQLAYMNSPESIENEKEVARLSVQKLITEEQAKTQEIKNESVKSINRLLFTRQYQDLLQNMSVPEDAATTIQANALIENEERQQQLKRERYETWESIKTMAYQSGNPASWIAFVNENPVYRYTDETYQSASPEILNEARGIYGQYLRNNINQVQAPTEPSYVPLPVDEVDMNDFL